ncbi:MAG: ferrochelatase [Chitinophagaceae bacterium]|nr:ferrochelatase [Chitinophagaceae bacterium]
MSVKIIKTLKKDNKKKIAIVLFNLGGPDKLESVKPFLFNLFYDKYIIRLPSFLRYIIAYCISTRREKIAQEIYARMGGGSTILPETQNQKNALKKYLQGKVSFSFEIFICMRHWHPMSQETVQKISHYQPTEIILLPLYPQLSTTTSCSSIEDFHEKQKLFKNLVNIDTKTICCYPNHPGFIKAHVEILMTLINQIKDKTNYRVIFSAHGLPERIIKSGDPYQYQVELTVEKIVNNIPFKFDYIITYQSKVGPLNWLEPATDQAIKNAAEENLNIIIVPVAFVSEHSETLVELDLEYKEIAKEHNVGYYRAPTLSINEYFISRQPFNCQRV